jgi:hypothetical protein
MHCYERHVIVENAAAGISPFLSSRKTYFIKNRVTGGQLSCYFSP